jgi:hypothetical protein
MNVEKTKVMKISRQPSSIPIMIDEKPLENVGYLNYLGSMIMDYARITRDVKSRIGTTKSAFSKKKTLVSSKLYLHLRKKLIKCCIWSIALHGAGEEQLDRSCEN